MSTSAFIFDIICQITTYFSKTNALNLFTISDLSVSPLNQSLKYLIKDLLDLCLDTISFIVLRVFVMKFKIIKIFLKTCSAKTFFKMLLYVFFLNDQ